MNRHFSRLAVDWDQVHLSVHPPNPSPTPPAVAPIPPIPHAAPTTGGGKRVHLNSDDRAQKPNRKRPRTSRRPPTTLLNTDTSNFRAMVQQFTGVPLTPYGTSGAPNGPSTISFELGFNRPQHHQMSLLPNFQIINHHHHHHQQQQQQQQTMLSQHSQQQQQMMRFATGGGDLPWGPRNPTTTTIGGLTETFFLDGMGGELPPGLPLAGRHGEGYFSEL